MRLALMLSLLLAPLALAQDAAASPVAAPSIGLQLGSALADLLMAALIAGLGFLARYLATKSAESRAAKVGLVVTEASRAAVLELDRTLKPQLQAALADGVLTDAEKKQLKDAAVDLLKTKLPAGLLGMAGGIFGAFTDTYLAGKVEQAVVEKNAALAAGAKMLADVAVAGIVGTNGRPLAP